MVVQVNERAAVMFGLLKIAAKYPSRTTPYPFEKYKIKKKSFDKVHWRVHYTLKTWLGGHGGNAI